MLKDNMLFIGLPLGLFIGNWLIVPLFGLRSFREGFFIGLIAAVLSVFCLLVGKEISRRYM